MVQSNFARFENLIISHQEAARALTNINEHYPMLKRYRERFAQSLQAGPRGSLELQNQIHDEAIVDTLTAKEIYGHLLGNKKED